MQNNLGFIIINIYAFLVIIATSIIFFSKERMKQIEDELYKKLLLSSILMSLSGLILGFIVSSNTSYFDIIATFNKFYLISLSLWISILTFYIIYVSKKNIEINKFKSIFNILLIICPILIILLPIKVEIIKGGNAISSGLSVIFTYLMFIIGFLTQIFCVFSNNKKLKNKKFIPLYLLIFFGIIILIALIINPKLNYIINPTLIFITFVMYFTIENPDAKMIEEVHNAKIISDNANEEKTMFLYNISNEIKNIGKEINNEIDNILIESDNKKTNIESLKNSAREIKSLSSKFTTMTNEVLDITNIDSSTIKIYNEKYNIKLLLKEIINKYTTICQKKNIELRTNIEKDIPDILYGDSVGVKNAITTLLDNSVKYTKKGYIELNINSIKKQDIVRIIISIEDSGIGIKSNELDKIFNKNKEVLNKNNLKNNLFTVKKIITLMNGTIIANSTYNKGTTMKIVLDQKYEITNNIYDKTYNQKKILLIENNDTTYKLITKILKNTNILIDRVELGSEGLEKIRNKEKYDLIFIEEDLKPLNAYDIIKKLNEIKNFDTKVILITQNTNIEYSYLYKDYNFSDYIIKPIDKNRLSNIINKY